MTHTKITTLQEAVELFLRAVVEYAHRDYDAAFEAAVQGETRLHPVIGINYNDPSEDTTGDKGAFEIPEVDMPDTPEGKLARNIINSLRPLEMFNPVRSAVGLGGRSPQELITCFGIPLNPEVQYSPAFHKTIDQVLSEPMPDVRTTGSMWGFKEKIELIKAHTPETVKVARFDTQGPFNIAHSLVGEEIMTAPYLVPEKYHRFMSALTDFWIESIHVLREWIGPERQYRMDEYVRIAECSCNLISSEMYEEFVLPYDLRIAKEFGPLSIHPCSGPHVFHQTLDLLPEVGIAEAGFIDPKTTAAGAISVDEALEAIESRPVVLIIGQELPEGEEFEFIQRDIDRYETNKRLMFGYTGMYWKHEDRPFIRELHNKVDEYWAAKYHC